jgi:hypothetical protein
MSPVAIIAAIFGSIIGLSLLAVVRFYIFRLRLRLKAKMLKRREPAR